MPTTAPQNAQSHIAFACLCGSVRGIVRNASPRSVTRVRCYCDDCQAFAYALGREDILDASGGSDVIQIAPATMTIRDGHQRVAAMRLTEKGLHRFHATCCGTPLGNTSRPSIPVIGIPRQAFEVDGQDPDTLFGPSIGGVYAADAIGTAAPGVKGVPVRILVRIISRILCWRLAGRAWPHPFFERATGTPAFPVRVLPAERRDALRRQLAGLRIR